MKKFNFSLAILAIALVFGLAFVSCDDGSGSTGGTGGGGSAGTLVVTGIPSQYNGRYAGVEATGTISGVSLAGYQSIDFTTSSKTYVPISNGRASFQLLTYNTHSTYNGTEPVVLNIKISEKQTSAEAFYVDNVTTYYNAIPFTNGGATLSWADYVSIIQ